MGNHFALSRGYNELAKSEFAELVEKEMTAINSSLPGLRKNVDLRR